MPVGLYQLHTATAEQLCRLHYSPKSIKWVKAKLKTLTDHEYVQPDAYGMKHWSQSGKIYFTPHYYYTLGQKGMRYLEMAGLDISESFRASKEMDRHSLFVKHALELSDLLISAELLRRVSRSAYLDAFRHERELRAQAYKTKSFTVIPDAFLRFMQADRAVRFLIEHDRGTEEQQHFRRRINAYADYLKEEPITVLFSTFEGSKRLEQMRDWTRKELNGSTLGSFFRFACFEPPLHPRAVWLEPCWYTVSGQTLQSLLSET